MEKVLRNCCSFRIVYAVIHKILRCIFEIVCYTQYVVQRNRILGIRFFRKDIPKDAFPAF